MTGALVLISILGLPAPARPESPPVRRAVIDPALAGQIEALGTAPVMLAWDRTTADRGAIVRYLEGSGLDFDVLDPLSVAFVCAGSARDLRTLAAAPGVASVWGDHPLTPALDRSVRTAFNGDPKNVWEGLGVTGKGVDIALVDTGLDATHPDLQFGIKTKLNVRAMSGKHDTLGPWSEGCLVQLYTDQQQDTELTSGHGTHIAGVAAGDGTASGGRYTGVAPGAKLVSVAVTDTASPRAIVDDYNQISLLNAVAGMAYVGAIGVEGCRVGNWYDDPPGCAEHVDVTAKVVLAGFTLDELHYPNHPMTYVVRDLGWYGINVVFPAGNAGPDTSDCSAVETCHYNPFAVAPAIGVAATPKRSRVLLEAYSSRGDPVTRIVRNTPVRYQPLLAAPGTGVVATRRAGLAPYAQPPGSNLGGRPADLGQQPVDRRYVAMSGTSVAAAHVAGAIALMQEAAARVSGCYLTAPQVYDILRSTADPMPGYQSHEVGAGAIDVAAAVEAARVGGPPNPDPWMCPGLS